MVADAKAAPREVSIPEDAEPIILKQVSPDVAHNHRQGRNARKRLDRQVQFISDIAHDLRTPLSAIGEFAQLLRSGQTGDLSGLQQRYVGIIERRCGDAARLIGNLLDGARLQSGCIHPHRQALELPEIFGDIRETMELAIRHSGTQFAIATPADMPRVFADRDMLTRILANLVSNAIKFSPANSTVTIRAERFSVSMARVSVIDCGTGISSQDLRKIFHRFRQGSNHAPTGVGLGLAIVRELVQVHGGNVVVESAMGKGTRFHFTLPLFIPSALIRRYLGQLVKDPSLTATAWWIDCDEAKRAAVHRLISATVRARDLVLPEGEQGRILLMTQSKRPESLMRRLCRQISEYGGVEPSVTAISLQDAKLWLSQSSKQLRPLPSGPDPAQQAG
jgi:nitrogen-specific signal transduction histidine kinase